MIGMTSRSTTCLILMNGFKLTEPRNNRFGWHLARFQFFRIAHLSLASGASVPMIAAAPPTGTYLVDDVTVIPADNDEALAHRTRSAKRVCRSAESGKSAATPMNFRGRDGHNH